MSDLDVRIAEAIKPVKVPDNQFFVISERSAQVLKEVPPGSKEVPIPERQWSIIVSNQESGENRARVVTVKNRTELVRRTKQETRRLGNPIYQVTGGELRAVSPSGQGVFLTVTSWVWGGEPRAQAKVQEAVTLSPEELELIRDVQQHLAAGVPLSPQKLDSFLEIDIGPNHEVDERGGPDSILAGAAAKAMESVAKGYALEGAPRAELLEAAWGELNLSYIVVEETSLAEALECADDRNGYLDAIGMRVIQQWPGFLSFDRMLADDRILMEVQEALMVRVCSGSALDMRSSWERFSASEPDDHTGKEVDPQDLSAVGLTEEDSPGEQHGQGASDMQEIIFS